MKLSQVAEKINTLDVKTLTPEQLATRHRVPLDQIESQLRKGIKHELEHSTHRSVAREIALDHLKEDPRYYDKLEKALPEDEETPAPPITDKEKKGRNVKAAAVHINYLRRRIAHLPQNKEGRKEKERLESYVEELEPLTRIRAKTKGPGFENPYLLGARPEDRYAGDPEHIPQWSSPQMKEMYETLKGILARNGLKFDIMYAGTFQSRGNRYNFVVIGANGRFVWRKYDPSLGAGMNWIIIDGKEMKTSQFLKKYQETDAQAAKRQDKMLQGLL